MPVTGDMCQYPGGLERGIMLTDLMAGKDNFPKTVDANEILIPIPQDPSAAFDKELGHN